MRSVTLNGVVNRPYCSGKAENAYWELELLEWQTIPEVVPLVEVNDFCLDCGGSSQLEISCRWNSC